MPLIAPVQRGHRCFTSSKSGNRAHLNVTDSLLTPTLTASRSRVSTKSADPSAERVPLPACHFALANLVYDFAGLHLALSVFRNGLSLGQKTKHPSCDLRF